MAEERGGIVRQVLGRWLEPLLGGAGVLLVLIILLFFARGWTPRASEPLRAAELVPVAVMPLEDLSSPGNPEAWSPRCTRALVGALGAAGFEVLPFEAVESYAGSLTPLTVIAEEIGAETLVVGTVLHHEDRLRLTVRIERPAEGSRVLRTSAEVLVGGQRDPAELLAEHVAGQLAERVGSASAHLDATR